MNSNMYGSKLALFMGCLFAIDYGACGIAGLVGIDGYSQIEKYLQANVQSIDYNDNLRAAKEWLSSLESGQRAAKLRETLKEFLQLEQALNISSCNHEGHQVLLSNDAILKEKRLIGIPRVAFLVDQVKRFHADMCDEEYKKRFEKIMSHFDPFKEAEAKAFVTDDMINRFIEGIRAPMTNRRVEYFLNRNPVVPLNINFVWEKSIAEYAIDALKRFANGNEGSECLIKAAHGGCEQMIATLFREVVIEPWRDYAMALQSDVFGPHRYDLANCSIKGEKGSFKLSAYQKAWVRVTLFTDTDMDELARRVANQVVGFVRKNEGPLGEQV